ncbi:hypothetical protein A2625_06120 [candidate division WOR-1 bacterium RIFCSPHIGHO2_01_FULL_53_15]|uniref:AbiEi antitoxin C-terminal domain-containing protein n=1 Tax=candidate division WOR-1 bacterium RIFCSPHIGHO2_01_FULL_53_15 TaxID=1802564 RepID=A0A1F4Q1E1_UNCSA|nr:MAG: hypothetical protein A2625_06120 [candidate division WOR-1 bacterium RIFCSPHIGHO2_01_FULL_53_15]OGC13834.1 MAG: hypothetical protein A3D23_02100 [candidate division WOR-1 bacterium RIFCSPHIGHO2_02_FULL_53_26]
MRYEEFRQKVKGLPLITSQFMALLAGADRSVLVQFRRWVKAGKIIKLRKGLYLLNQSDRRINPSRLFIANEIYSPSYVSLEYALSFYGLIPEKAVDVTCVTSKKTANYKNSLGQFIYQHIKERCFTGFEEFKDEAGLVYFMATPEKAAVDFLYLNQDRFKSDYDKLLAGSFRFQDKGSLNAKKLMSYAKLFNSRKLERIVKALSRDYKNE